MTDESDKDIIVSDFKKLNNGLAPLINEWLKENPVDIRATIYFLSSLVKELLKDLQQQKFSHFKKFKESVALFVLSDKEE